MAIPQFDLPFRFSGADFVTTEQGQPPDIANCIFAVCVTEPGQFLDLPQFGLSDLTFEQEPIPTAKLHDAIAVWESRLPIALTANPAVVDEAIENINIEVGGVAE